MKLQRRMGSRASSSKRKLKRDKISSKKKSRRKESKKHRRYYDSACSSSDELERRLSTSKSNHKRRTSRIKKRRHDSSSSSYSDYQSVSSSYSDSSSTDGYDYKIRKPRRSRVGINDTKRKVRKKSTSSIADEDASSGRKRKRIGRDHDIRPIKKSSKKKPRKDVSSSSSSDSGSCSTCQSGSSSSTTSDKHQRKSVVSNKEKGRLRDRGWDKGKRKDRSQICTLIGSGDEEFFPVDYTQRLRSVITIVDRSQNEEENRWEKDPHEEEIVDDQNDHPSAKSLESNEDGTKIDPDNQSNVAFGDRICTENIAGEEVSELGKSTTDEGDHSITGDSELDKSVPFAASGGDVLESILRRKALENLRKFKERPRACPRSNMMKINNKTNVVGLSDGTIDTIPSESTEQGCSSHQEMNPGSGILSQREIVEVVKLPDSEQDEKKPGLTKPNIMHSGNGAVLLHCSGDDKSECSRAVVAEAVEPTSTKPTSGCEQAKEANEGSQFEQKTMSVMRGGELVQVSYKVYIPNKSHALARRQLRR